MPSPPRTRQSDSRQKRPFTTAAPIALAPTSAAANVALQRLIDDHRRRNRPGYQPESAAASLPGPLGELTDSIREALDPGTLARQAPRALLVVAVACLVAGATFFVIGRSSTRYAVAGTVRVENAPLANGVLEFQLKAPAAGDKAFSTVIHTNGDGTFRRDAAAGLPPGTYTVVVKPRAHAAGGSARSRLPAAIAARGQRGFAPLSVEINGSATTLDLVVQN